LATFNGLLNARGVPADVCLRVAHVFLGMRNYESAEAAIRKALVVAPDFVEAQKTLIDLAMLRKRPAQAMDVARQVQKQRPTRAIGHLMEAEITAAQQNWDGAIGAMREALARERTTQLAARLHSLYLAAGRKPAAVDMAAGWLRDNPGDLGFMFHLAAVAVGAKDYPAAEAQYRAILAVQPEHPTSLNDLAWVLLQQGKPGAVQLAEKANRLLPSSATFMDTLSQALQAEKQNPQALLWAQKAVAAAPNKPEYRMNLAKCLIASGERDKARTELRALAALGSGFSAQADVSRLLREL
jgi:putative PEP-CTERM system TPR-repeat lipoprotein